MSETEIKESKERIRKVIIEAYQKFLNHEILTPLETELMNVIDWHAEYTDFLNEAHLTTEFNEDNPFFHIGLHLSIREQIVTDRPKGIKAIYERLLNKYDMHQVEHQIMACLAHHLQLAQKTGAPSEANYLKDLEQI